MKLNIPKTVKGARRSLGLTQSELARLMGVVPLTVYRWEHDRASPEGVALRLFSLISRIMDGECLSASRIEEIKFDLKMGASDAAFREMLCGIFGGLRAVKAVAKMREGR